MQYHGIDILQARIAEFCRRHRIRKMALFGSILRDDFKADSDVDVLIEFEPGVSVGLRCFAIERELSELIGRKVDLNTPGFLSKYIRDEILAESGLRRGPVQSDTDPLILPRRHLYDGWTLLPGLLVQRMCRQTHR
jgi:uncharacterized protein